jgi:hypothetical protein
MRYASGLLMAEADTLQGPQERRLPSLDRGDRRYRPEVGTRTIEGHADGGMSARRRRVCRAEKAAAPDWPRE